MENVPLWHYRLPNPDELKEAFQELGVDIHDGVSQ